MAVMPPASTTISERRPIAVPISWMTPSSIYIESAARTGFFKSPVSRTPMFLIRTDFMTAATAVAKYITGVYDVERITPRGTYAAKCGHGPVREDRIHCRSRTARVCENRMAIRSDSDAGFSVESPGPKQCRLCRAADEPTNRIDGHAVRHRCRNIISRLLLL